MMNKKQFQNGLAMLLPLVMVAETLTVIAGCARQEENVVSMHEGHGYVDLGLPSGTMWSTVNVGGEQDSLATDYYAWGETETKMSYSKGNYQWADGYPEAYTLLQEKDDVAHVKWGGKWRLPTKEQIDELSDTVNNTTWIVSPVKGHLSCIVKSKRNGKSIRMISFGYINNDKQEQDSIGFYLGSTVGTKMKNKYYCLGFCRDTVYNDESGRHYGFPARPVFK